MQESLLFVKFSVKTAISLLMKEPEPAGKKQIRPAVFQELRLSVAGGGVGNRETRRRPNPQARPLSRPSGGCECTEGREINHRGVPGKSGGELLPLCSVFLFFFF